MIWKHNQHYWKSLIRIQPKGWDAKIEQFYVIEGAENILPDNDILPNLGIKLSQQLAQPSNWLSKDISIGQSRRETNIPHQI